MCDGRSLGREERGTRGSVKESLIVGWDLGLLTSLVPPQSGVCRLCLIKQLNMAL